MDEQNNLNNGEDAEFETNIPYEGPAEIPAEDSATELVEGSSEITAAEADPGTGNAVPAVQPADQKSPKGLLGIVIALAVVIVGLIVLLVVTILNKNKEEEKTPDPTPTQSVSTEITITPDITGTTNNEGKEDDEKNGSSETTTIPADEIPTFNVTTVLGQYKGIEVDYQLPEVTEEDIEGSLEYFRNSCTQKADITDRELKEGDTVVIDFTGTINGEEFKGGSATNAEVTLGNGLLIPGFEKGLVGKKAGDSVSLDLKFPDTYQDAEVAGKDVNFQVKINSAYEYVVPELTDELVAANSEYKTVAEYREAAKEELAKQAKEYADAQLQNDIVKKLIEGATFSGQINEQIEYEKQDAISYYDTMCMQQFGVDGATYFGYIWGLSSEDYYAMVQEEAETAIKYNYVLDEIAKAENFTVSDEEYKKMFEETFYDNYGFTSEEEVYSQITKEQAEEAIRGYVLHDKAEALIMDNAIINNKPEK